MVASGSGSMPSRPAEANIASSEKVPSGPRNATCTSSAAGFGDDTLAERGADSLVLFGRHLDLGAALPDPLHVHPGLIAMQDRGQHDAGALVVEQRHRARLPTAHLAVGVVAHDGRAADAAVDPPLVAGEAILKLVEGVLDEGLELGEADL